MGNSSPNGKFDSRNPYRQAQSTTHRQLFEDQSISVLDNSIAGHTDLGITLKKPKFGIDGYYLPKTMHDIIKVPKFIKKDFKRSNDIYAESRKFVPPPGIYDLNKIVHDTKKYRIYAMERKTFVEELPKL